MTAAWCRRCDGHGIVYSNVPRENDYAERVCPACAGTGAARPTSTGGAR